MVHSLLVAVLAGLDIYYIHTDVMLLARLAGARGPVLDTPPAHHAWAILALGGVVVLMILRAFWNRRR